MQDIDKVCIFCSNLNCRCKNESRNSQEENKKWDKRNLSCVERLKFILKNLCVVTKEMNENINAERVIDIQRREECA